MKKKGFTLVELLAVIIILGLIGTVAVMLVSKSVENSRKKSFASLGKNYGESVRKLRAEDKLPYIPKDGEAVIFLAEFLEVKNPGNVSPFAKLILDKSYVAVVKDLDGFKYYVTLIDEKYNGIIAEDFNLIGEKSIKTEEEGTREVFGISTIKRNQPITINNFSYKYRVIRDKYIIMQRV